MTTQIDYSPIFWYLEPVMEKIPISEFKATCLSVLERVRKTGQAVLITKHGQPIAEVVPPHVPEQPRRGFLGRLRGTALIIGDITEPVMSAEEFECGCLEDWDEANK